MTQCTKLLAPHKLFVFGTFSLMQSVPRTCLGKVRKFEHILSNENSLISFFKKRVNDIDTHNKPTIMGVLFSESTYGNGQIRSKYP